MKINTLLITAILSVFLLGCSNDGDEGNSNGNPNDPTAGNRLGLGESANDLLSDTEFTTLTVEFIVDDSVETNSFALSVDINSADCSNSSVVYITYVSSQKIVFKVNIVRHNNLKV